MRMAIASRNYQTFSRPLPLSTVQDLAFQKNQTKLKEIESGQGDDGFETTTPKTYGHK